MKNIRALSLLRLGTVILASLLVLLDIFTMVSQLIMANKYVCTGSFYLPLLLILSSVLALCTSIFAFFHKSTVCVVSPLLTLPLSIAKLTIAYNLGLNRLDAMLFVC